MQICPLCLQGFWTSLDLSLLPKNSMLAAFQFRLLLVFNTDNSVSCSHIVGINYYLIVILGGTYQIQWVSPTEDAVFIQLSSQLLVGGR